MSAPDPRARLGRCGARTRGGGLCKQPAGHGTDHVGHGQCKLHGGSTPSGRKAAIAAEARAEVARFGGSLDVHPAQALLQLVRQKAAEVAYWSRRADALAEQELTWGATKHESGYKGDEGMVDVKTFEARRHIVLDSLHVAQRDLAAFSAASLKAGVDAALVDLAKLQATDVLDLLEGVLARLDLTEGQRAAIPAALADTIGARQ